MRPPSAVRIWTASVAALAVILTAVMLMAGPGVFTIDEHAYRFQTELVEQGVWGLRYPTAEVFDQKLGAPLSNSELGDTKWYPAARHPAYIHLLRAGSVVSPHYGPILVSIIGVLLTAVGIEHVARWLGRVPRWSAFWFAGLGSPAAFHGLVSWAHAPALGLVAVGLALVLRSSPRQLLTTVLAVAALAGAILLRSDGPVAAAAIGGGLLVGSRRDPANLYRFGVAGVGGVVGLAGSLVWHGSVVEPGTIAGAGTGRSFDVSRYVLTFLEIFLYPGTGLAVLRVIAVGLFATALLWYRRVGHAGGPAIGALAILATAFGLVGAVASGPYGSLLPAAPLIVIGTLGLTVGADVRSRPMSSDPGNGPLSEQESGGDRLPAGEDRLWRSRAMMLATMATVAMVIPVLATLSGGGGLGWGGRYVLLALAPLVPLAMAGAATLWRTPATRAVVVGAVAVTAAIQVSGGRTLVTHHQLSADAPDSLAEDLAALQPEFEVLATSDPRIGRVAAEQASTAPLISVGSKEQLEELLEAAAQARLTEVAVVSMSELEPLALPAGWAEIASREEDLHVLVVGTTSGAGAALGDEPTTADESAQAGS